MIERPIIGGLKTISENWIGAEKLLYLAEICRKRNMSDSAKRPNKSRTKPNETKSNEMRNNCTVNGAKRRTSRETVVGYNAYNNQPKAISNGEKEIKKRNDSSAFFSFQEDMRDKARNSIILQMIRNPKQESRNAVASWRDDKRKWASLLNLTGVNQYLKKWMRIGNGFLQQGSGGGNWRSLSAIGSRSAQSF